MLREVKEERQVGRRQGDTNMIMMKELPRKNMSMKGVVTTKNPGSEGAIKAEKVGGLDTRQNK